MARVLIIDDDEMVRVSLEMILGMNGWQTELAAGGFDGLAKARRSPPDLILCDLNMRGMNGLETLAEIRKDAVLKSVPVVMMTGSESDESEGEALRQGAQAVLVKPFNVDQLVQLAETHTSRRRKSDDPGPAGPGSAP